MEALIVTPQTASIIRKNLDWKIGSCAVMERITAMPEEQSSTKKDPQLYTVEYNLRVQYLSNLKKKLEKIFWKQ